MICPTRQPALYGELAMPHQRVAGGPDGIGHAKRVGFLITTSPLYFAGGDPSKPRSAADLGGGCFAVPFLYNALSYEAAVVGAAWANATTVTFPRQRGWAVRTRPATVRNIFPQLWAAGVAAPSPTLDACRHPFSADGLYGVVMN